MPSIQYEPLTHVKPAITAPSKLVMAIAVLTLFVFISLLVGEVEPPAPDYHGNSGSIAYSE